MEKSKKPNLNTEMSLENQHRPPETAEEMVNCFGTYEIQPTADTDNQYPAIAQGYNKKQQKFEGDRPEAADHKKR